MFKSTNLLKLIKLVGLSVLLSFSCMACTALEEAGFDRFIALEFAGIRHLDYTKQSRIYVANSSVGYKITSVISYHIDKNTTSDSSLTPIIHTIKDDAKVECDWFNLYISSDGTLVLDIEENTNDTNRVIKIVLLNYNDSEGEIIIEQDKHIKFQ